MAIEKSTDNATIEDSVKRLVVRLGMPACDDLFTIREAVDVETFLIGRPAAKADACRRILLLQGKVFGHIFMQTSTPGENLWRT